MKFTDRFGWGGEALMELTIRLGWGGAVAMKFTVSKLQIELQGACSTSSHNSSHSCQPRRSATMCPAM